MPDKLTFLFSPKRYKVAYGGRGSGKTMSFARAAILRAWQSRCRILCTRELQKSLKESVFSLIKSQIEVMGLTDAFDMGETYIRGKNGSEFIFMGIRSNYTEIKGLDDIDIAWLEEAENTSDESFTILKNTVRKSGSEIWIAFNPKLRSDPIYKMFVISPPENAIVQKINWRDNPWFPEELENERQYDMQHKPDMYNWIWEGEPLSEGDMSFFTYQEVEAAMNCPDFYQSSRLIIGCDPSMGKNDGTAFAYRYGDYVPDVERHMGMDEMHCVGFLKLRLDSDKSLERIVIDTAVGNAIRGRLVEMGYRNVTGVNFGGTDLDANYANNRTAMYAALRAKMRDGSNFKIPNDPELLEELTAIQWKLTSAGKTILAPKDDIKTIIGRSPDKADALALAFTPSISSYNIAGGRLNRPKSKLGNYM